MNPYTQATILGRAIDAIFDSRGDAVKDAVSGTPWIFDWIVQNLNDAGYEIREKE